MGFRWRQRRGRRGRLPKPLKISSIPSIDRFVPVPQLGEEPIPMDFSELEVLRLVDLDGLTQEEAGQKMGVSRGTVWRILTEARKKVAKALAEGRPIVVQRYVETK